MKKKLLLLLLTILTVFSLTGCSEEFEEWLEDDSWEDGWEESSGSSGSNHTDASQITLSESTGDGWVIYWYLCGSDLESDDGSATEDLDELMAVNLPDNVQVIIETGGASEWQNDIISSNKIGRYLYDKNGLQLIEELPNANMGSAKTLADFLYFGATNYPSAHSALIFWNHGGGSLSGAAFDENYNYDAIDLLELYSALDSVFVANTENPPLDILGFDTCLMATIDVADVAKEFAHYLVASEEVEPGNGWYYTGWLQALADNPSMNGDGLGIAICSSFYEGCEMYGNESDVTLSVTDLTKIQPLLTAYEAFGNECLQEATGNSGFFAQFSRCAQKSENYGGNNDSEGYTNMVDLGHLARNTAWLIPSAQSVVDALEDCVLYKISGTYRAEATGLSCFYAYDGKTSSLNTYERVGAGEAFKHLFSYGLTGTMSDATQEYVEQDLGITEVAEPMSLSHTDWEDIPFQIGDDGYSYITLGAEANDVLSEISFYLFGYADGEDDLLFLGSDNDIYCDWDKGIFYDNFQGTWGCINDIPVFMELTYADDSYNKYSVPILLNNEEYSLIVSYDYSIEDYVVLGARQGLDDTGMASKELRSLQDGDVIDIIWKYYSEEETEYTDEDGMEMYTVDTITYDKNFRFTTGNLPDGMYAMVFCMTDAFGETFLSDVVMFDMSDGNIEASID